MKALIQTLRRSEKHRRFLVDRLLRRAAKHQPAPSPAPASNQPQALRHFPRLHSALPAWLAWFFVKLAG